MTNANYIQWLESMIVGCDELGGMEREKAVYQDCLKKARTLVKNNAVLPHVVGRSERLEAKRKDFCLWYYAQSQPLDANKIADWFASN